MLFSYLKASVRYLDRHRLYALINVVGLAVSLAACILITVYVRGELSFDRHWDNSAQVYRANFITKRPGRDAQYYPISSELMLPAMRQFFGAEIARGARIYQAGPQAILIDDSRYPDPVLWADEDLIDMFQFETLHGDLRAAFGDINSIALSEQSAIRYFGDSNPVGRTLTGELGGGEYEDYQVVAVYRLRPGNTVLDIPNLALYDQEKVARGSNFFESWLRISVQTFVQLGESASASNPNTRMAELLDQYASLPQSRLEAGQTPSDVLGIELQSIGDIYLNPIPFINIDQESGNRLAVLALLGISVLVVVIGCINFVVLATALTNKRALEVAIRKVHGARPEQLVGQYLGESLLLTLVAFVIALLVVLLGIGSFANAVNKDLSLGLNEVSTWLALAGLYLTVGILACFYPALVLARQRPGQALHDESPQGSRGFFNLRNILLVFQFSISIVLIMTTMAIYGQLYYTSQRDPGLNTENLITVQGLGQDELSQYKQVVKQELLRLPEVTQAGYSAVPPNSGLGLILDYSALGDDPNGVRDLAMSTLMIGFDFFETYEIPLLAGRYPQRGRDAEQELLFMLEVSGQQIDGLEVQPATIVINESAVSRLGFANPEDAVGARIDSGNPDEPSYQEYEIIGVVADTQFRSLRTAPDAEIYYLLEDRSDLLTLRFQGDTQAALARATATWESIIPGETTIVASAVEEALANTFAQERNEGLLLLSFSLLSLAVASLGLFGIATFNVERRARETGLRKVLGAETHHIITLLLWQLSKPVLVANLLAWPLGTWAIISWLERFPYQFDRWLLAPLCLVAGLTALLIAWTIIILKTHHVASSNPIRSLHRE